MKKFYTLIGAALIAGSASAQVYFGKDFEDQDVTTGGCQNQIVTGTNDWYASTFSGNSFAKVSNGGAGDAEVWYITPGIDLTGATSPIFSFASAANFSGPDIEVFTSIDYDGTSDPTTQGTWTPLSPALSTGNNYDWVNSGEVTVPATSATTYFAFKYTGTATSGMVWEVDSIFVAEAGEPFDITVIPPPPSTVSIYDIQNSSGASTFDGQNVSTGGVVTYIRDDGSYYIQDPAGGPFSGILVYDVTNTPTIGDSVTMNAQVDEYFDLTELKNVSNFTTVSSGNFFLSTPISTNEIATEEYESVFVSICGQCITEEGQYQDWTINDGSGVGNVDNYNADFHPSGTNITAPVMNTYYSVKGIVDYSFSEFKLLPRVNSDVVESTSMCGLSINEEAVDYTLYPNPASGNITLEVEGNHLLNITDISGKVIATMNVSGMTTISLSELTAGIYFFNLEGNVTKVIVK
ncbi:T9SS-dependent choice-of-anchor J family protein [Parvicella tangerina]|uniref:Secretion system C-terminal sorting domain-containing protein n=1 Tax=Parvicella tangerina TaxID=2829795 RepID=A0A916JKF7_9FLAO|nr:choice-of-anchor J domain-containing protein [Parvicella tangerina]CAG5078888.1 hypothetical protein CRYO30217_00798 [Parvicella tangerina]